jgi:hypothetical protein
MIALFLSFVSGRYFYISSSSEADLLKWMECIREHGPALPDSFSEPTQMEHKIHVRFDTTTGTLKVHSLILTQTHLTALI